jgi:FAD/FMN-containing dehydrogenase
MDGEGRKQRDVAGLDGGLVTLTSDQFSDLAARFDGSVLLPGNDGWEPAVRIWNGMAAKTPALVLQPTSSAGVAAAVAFAREHRLLLAIKGQGHNIAGTSMAEAGITLDMARMSEVVVEPEARLAHAGPGCRLGDVDRATQAHGLATVLGFISEVGVAGLTLGGGLGYLTRRFGWTVDNLEEVEVVTADATVHRANRRENDDLFWALRGGGGNFGVVTRFTYRLHPVGPRVYGGLIAWPFDRAEEVMRTYRSLTTRAPVELAAWLVLLRGPAAPFVPPEWHGRRLCAMAICHSGDPDAVAPSLAPLRTLGDPVVDLLGERSYVEVQSYLDATEPKGHHYYWRTDHVADLGDELLATVRELFASCPMPLGEVGFLHLEGALNRRAPDDGAVGNRDARWVVGVKGMWSPSDADDAAFRAWVRDAGARIRPFSAGNYVNFQTEDEGADRIRATYGANYERLVRVKRRYDPDNLFRVNRNIAP